jgi:hypothetical protein
MVSKRVKHNTNVEGGHPQGINFATLALIKACKTHYKR